MDTIFAVSSGVGRSAIAVIRVSGSECAATGLALFGRVLKPRVATLVTVRDPVSSIELDQSLCLSFPGPASFTGEDCLELHVHGGRAVVQSVLAALASQPGLRAAEPGEFTRRAFDNGKMSLDSAEGLADLIQADTLLQQRLALSAMRGGLEALIENWRRRVIASQAMLEAWLDFPDESEISDTLIGECREAVTELVDEIHNAHERGQRAEILRNGVKVLIAGPPNAGKSSLLNRLAQRDAAIVSDIPGTTRDILQIALDVGGIPLTFLDGAGIRATHDVIENLGIERVRKAAEIADIVIWLSAVDEERSEPPDWLTEHGAIRMPVSSKVDLLAGHVDGVSVLTGQGINQLMVDLAKEAEHLTVLDDEPVQLRQRHLGAVDEALRQLRVARMNVERGLIELASEDFRQALAALGRVSQPAHSEDILDEVFARFCIGK